MKTFPPLNSALIGLARAPPTLALGLAPPPQKKSETTPRDLRNVGHKVTNSAFPLPVMKRSGMMLPKTPPLIFSSRGASGVALGMRRDAPGERGFLGRGSGARRDSPAQPSHNARFASPAGLSGHVGSRRADSRNPRRGLAVAKDGFDFRSIWRFAV